MKKFVLPLAAALMVAAAGSAHAGKIYFTAYQDGKQASIRADKKAKMAAFPAQIEVVTQTGYDKMSANKKKNYSATEMCGEKYYLTRKNEDWVKAHQDAKHDIQVRDNVKRGQYQVVCPKEAAAPPPGNPGTPATPGTPGKKTQ